MAIEACAPAKVNLTLHVTGRRDDGFHMLDSLVAFADIGDRIVIEPAAETVLTVTGPEAAGVPTGADNLVLRAAELAGAPPVHMVLEKHLPVASGIGGGSSDAAAALRALSELSGQPLAIDPLTLGADVPVCLAGHAARLRGIGEVLTPADIPEMDAVLVNPRVPVSTAEVFGGLENRSNPPMPDRLPRFGDVSELAGWLSMQRNDLQDPAISLNPKISRVLRALSETSDCLLARMSGSGATCFGIYPDAEGAASAADSIAQAHPGWWARSCRLS